MPIANVEKLSTDVCALFVAHQRTPAEEDVSVYVSLIARNLEDWEWEWAYDVFTKTARDDGRGGDFMPTTGQLITTGHLAPRPGPRQIPRRVAAREFWRSESEAEFWEAVVHDNPIDRERENDMDYIQRIAILTGAKPLAAMAMEFRPANAARFALLARRCREETGETETEGHQMPCGCRGNPGVLGTMGHLAESHGWSRAQLASWLAAEVA